MQTISLHIDVIGEAWGSFEARMDQTLTLAERPSQEAIDAFAAELTEGSARATLAGQSVEFGDFQYLTDCELTLVTVTRTGHGNTLHEERDSEIVREFADDHESDDAEDDGQPDEAQEWADYDPEC